MLQSQCSVIELLSVDGDYYIIGQGNVRLTGVHSSQPFERSDKYSWTKTFITHFAVVICRRSCRTRATDFRRVEWAQRAPIFVYIMGLAKVMTSWQFPRANCISDSMGAHWNNLNTYGHIRRIYEFYEFKGGCSDSISGDTFQFPMDNLALVHCCCKPVLLLPWSTPLLMLQVMSTYIPAVPHPWCVIKTRSFVPTNRSL